MMVLFFPHFWKVFLRNISCGCQASKSPPSSLILGGAWSAPFFSLLYSGPSMAGFHLAVLFFHAIDGGFE